jgi:hypothetical protein
VSLSDPGNVMARLEAIENDLAIRQNLLEAAAKKWYVMKRQKEFAHATEFMKAEGTVADRKAQADLETALMGSETEAEYEALKAVMRTLETRASIGQSILRTHNRV